jgi:type II secretory pathway pseudopilin PulG
VVVTLVLLGLAILGIAAAIVLPAFLSYRQHAGG